MKTKSVKELERQYDKVHNLNMPEADLTDTLEGIEGEIEIASEVEQRLNSLVTLDGWNLTNLFTEAGTLDLLLQELDEVARSIVWDVNTKEGRATGASIARKVSSSKVTADDFGKQLTDEWARKKAAVDAGRKRLRDFCDALRDDIKKPIEEWKAAEARKAEEVRLAAEFAADWDEAHRRNDLYDREAAVRKAEAAIAADKLAKEQALRESAAKAEQLIREQRAAEAAVEAERKRAADALEKTRQEEIARARNKEHRRKINLEVLTALMACELTEAQGMKVITAIATGMVPHVKLQY